MAREPHAGEKAPASTPAAESVLEAAAAGRLAGGARGGTVEAAIALEQECSRRSPGFEDSVPVLLAMYPPGEAREDCHRVR